ncbi:MAG: Fic family protein [Patescibacteria group bacterium]
MKLIPLSARQEALLAFLRRKDPLSAMTVAEALSVSIATIKRDMGVLVSAGYVRSTGKGRGAGYVLTKGGELFTPIDAHAYCAEEPDKRNAYARFDGDLFAAVLDNVFATEDLAQLDKATEQYTARALGAPEIIAKKELERFIIELSWKSSRIEGNTYTLLDTERLIREGIEGAGHTHAEAVMILNHKKAFEFVYTHRDLFVETPKLAAIEEIHRLLVADLKVSGGVRAHGVGITGTPYRPLDNQFQIREALDALRDAIEKAHNHYTAALIALLGISYIQPFGDGNKRTARLLANAVLLARACVPLSYRSVDEIAYREATLVFYETHSIVPFKEIFMAQYLFAAEQYGLR